MKNFNEIYKGTSLVRVGQNLRDLGAVRRVGGLEPQGDEPRDQLGAAR